MKKFAILGVAILSLMLFTGNSFAFLDDNSVDNSFSPNAEATASPVVNVTNGIVFPEPKDLTRTQIDAKGYRGFNTPTEMNYPGMPGYFGTATPGSSFQSCKTALIYKDTFTASELTLLAKDPFGSKVIVTPLVKEVADKDKAEFMKMMLSKPGEDLKVEIVGYITVKATGKNTVSMEVLAEAALAARDLGANVIHITAEGVDRELKAFGWGVGLSYTRASISDSEQSGGVAAGGTGISGGSAGYVDMPWFQVFALKVQ
jgi:hypothetical protein